jgi:hypothetical protein
LRELVYFVAVSLDGQIAEPDHTFDAFPVEVDHIYMILRDYTDTLPAPRLQALGLTPTTSRFDTVLMGWNTYAAGLAHGAQGWPVPPHPRQFVFFRSRGPRDAPPNITVTAENPVAVVATPENREHRHGHLAVWWRAVGLHPRRPHRPSGAQGQSGRLRFRYPAVRRVRQPAAQVHLVASTPYRSSVVVVNEYTGH